MTAKKKAKKSAKKLGVQISYIIQVSAGVLFLLMGIAGITGNNSVHVILEIIIAIIELACGIVLIAIVFAKIDKKLVKTVQLVSIVLWLLIITMLDILAPNFSSSRFDWLVWGQSLILHFIVLVSLFSIWKRKR